MIRCRVLLCLISVKTVYLGLSAWILRVTMVTFCTFYTVWSGENVFFNICEIRRIYHPTHFLSVYTTRWFYKKAAKVMIRLCNFDLVFAVRKCPEAHWHGPPHHLHLQFKPHHFKIACSVKMSADDILKCISYFFFQENWVWHFIPTVKSCFLGKI